MNIVFATHSYFSSVYRVGSHHLAMALGKLGHRVLHVSTPLTLGHFASSEPAYAERKNIWQAGLRAVGENVSEFVPLAPIPWPAAKRLLRRCKINAYLLWTPSLASISNRFFRSEIDLLIVDEPRFAGIERLVKAKRLCYRATDLYAVMRDDPFLVECERCLLEAADTAVGTASCVSEHLQAINLRTPCHVLRNGVDWPMFASPAPRPPEYDAIDRPILLYVGALDRRLDVDAIELASKTGFAVAVIGGGAKRLEQKLSELEHVHYFGPRPHHATPAYMQHAAVGFLPFSEAPENRGRSPMKLYEFLAAGTAVVAKATDELRNRNGEDVHLYRDHEELKSFLSLAGIAASENDVRRRQALAKGEDWLVVAEKLLLLCSNDQELVQKQ